MTEIVPGIAAIKAEYVVKEEPHNESSQAVAEETSQDAKEPIVHEAKKRKRGQNKNRDLRQRRDTVRICPSIIDPANKQRTCKYPDDPSKCKFSHDLSEYFSSKLPDNEGVCPQFEMSGICKAGIKCRWLKSHFDFETNTLVRDEAKNAKYLEANHQINVIDGNTKNELQKKKYNFEKSNNVIKYLDVIVSHNKANNNSVALEEKEGQADADAGADADADANKAAEVKSSEARDVDARKENQFEYVETPFKPCEKRRLNYNRAKVVSPLTTVGNLPFRRLMKSEYGVDVTFSEMALSVPLIQGQTSEWALIKAHSSERPGFGAQIAASKHWQAVKAAEVLTKVSGGSLSEINVNCGCPIDLLYKQGAGSALLDQPAKLERMVAGMAAVSDEIPITVKIRTGTKEALTSEGLVKRLLSQGNVSAITLHGRSRQQRYTREANWDYVKQVSQIVKDYNETQESAKDVREMPNKVFFLGNGDCYNYTDWYKAVEEYNVDTVMVARGALIKPWLFEEIDAQQHLDKSATERLSIIEKYSKYALDHWGTDEYGVNLARRFLCEWLSFTYRYIPVGILERVPHKMNERPPRWTGRNEMESLLASGDYKDWIKISEMFLGKASEGFTFMPKHKSNAY